MLNIDTIYLNLLTSYGVSGLGKIYKRWLKVIRTPSEVYLTIYIFINKDRITTRRNFENSNNCLLEFLIVYVRVCA